MKEKTVPMWLKISYEIENDITEGKYKDVDMLPTEINLCDIYGASRITIRGAMARLVEQGKIRRIKGKGTIINRKHVEDANSKINGFTTEMQKKGITPSTSYINLERKKASAYVRELFGAEQSDEFFTLERVRCINDVPLCHIVSYLPTDIGLSADPNDYYGSLYKIFDKELDCKIDYAKQTIAAEIPDKNTRELLNLLQGEPVLLVKRWAYHKKKLIEYSVSKYDCKRYECNIEVENS